MKRSEEYATPALPRATWSALRWLVVPVFLLALLLASASASNAHTLSHSMGDAAQTLSVEHLDTWSNVECCAGHEQDHSATPCAVVGPCVVCAVADPDPALVQPFSTELIGTMSAALPTGRNSVPAKHPPKMFLQV